MKHDLYLPDEPFLISQAIEQAKSREFTSEKDATQFIVDQTMRLFNERKRRGRRSPLKWPELASTEKLQTFLLLLLTILIPDLNVPRISRIEKIINLFVPEWSLATV